jgi:copper chaperone CopZ
MLRSVFVMHPRRLAVAPSVRVITHNQGETRLAIDGLVCAVCAARTHTALARLPDVRAVSVDLATGTAAVQRAPGATLSQASLDSALASVVVAPRGRRWLARSVAAIRGRS